MKKVKHVDNLIIFMELYEIFLILVGLCISYTVSGVVNSEIFVRRLNRGKFKEGFDKLLSKSSIMKKVDRLDKQISDPDFEKKIGRSMWESTRAEKGGSMKAIYAEEKAMLKDLGELGSFEFPNILKAAKEMQSMIDHELIKPEWGETFLKWSSFPRAQPYLEKVAGKLFEKLEENGGKSSYGSGGSDRMWV